MSLPSQLTFNPATVTLDFSLVQDLPLGVADGNRADFVSACTPDDSFFVAITNYDTSASYGQIYHYITIADGAVVTGTFYLAAHAGGGALLFATVANGFVFIVLQSYVVLRFTIAQLCQPLCAPVVLDIFVCDYYVSQSVGEPLGMYIGTSQIWAYYRSSVDNAYYAVIFDTDFNLVGSGRIGSAQTFSQFPTFVPGTYIAPQIGEAGTDDNASYAGGNGIFWLGENNGGDYEMGFIMASFSAEPLECGTTNTSTAMPVYQTYGSSSIVNYAAFNDFISAANLSTPSGSCASWPGAQVVMRGNQQIGVLVASPAIYGLTLNGLPGNGGTACAWVRQDGTVYAIGQSNTQPTNTLSLWVAAGAPVFSADPPVSVSSNIMPVFWTARIS